MVHWDSQYLKNSGSIARSIGFWKLLSFFLSVRVLDGVAKLKCQVCGSAQSCEQGQSVTVVPRQELHCLAWEPTAVGCVAVVVCRCHVFFDWRKATPLGLPPESFSNDYKLLISFHIVSSKPFTAIKFRTIICCYWMEH